MSSDSLKRKEELPDPTAGDADHGCRASSGDGTQTLRALTISSHTLKCDSRMAPESGRCPETHDPGAARRIQFPGER